MTNRNKRKRTRARIEQDRRERNRVHSSIVLREASFLLMVLIVLMLLTLVMGASNRKMEAWAASEMPPDAIWITTEQTVAPDQGIPMVERCPDMVTGHWEPAGRFKITFYCPCRRCNGRNPNRTASGAPLTPYHTAASSSKDFAFGTRILVDGKEYVIEDRGVGTGCLDLCVSGHQEALDLGTHRSEVYIWREEK